VHRPLPVHFSFSHKHIRPIFFFLLLRTKKRENKSGHAYIHTYVSAAPPSVLCAKTRECHPLTTCSSLYNVHYTIVNLGLGTNIYIHGTSDISFSHFTATYVVVNCITINKMASMNYCFTVCRAAEEKVQQENHSNTSSAAIDIPNSPSSTAGAYFFGRFFSFGLTPPALTSSITSPFVIKALDHNDNIF
jgi:hypothetical protein